MDTLRQEIKRLIINALDLEEMSPDDLGDEVPLFGDEGLGLDSIDALELGIALRKKYGLKLENDESGHREYFRSVASLAAWVERRRQTA
jgi:acyl carrier protein